MKYLKMFNENMNVYEEVPNDIDSKVTGININPDVFTYLYKSAIPDYTIMLDTNFENIESEGYPINTFNAIVIYKKKFNWWI